MKKGLWTVFFMVIITIVFIAALSAVNEITRERILENARIEYYKSILYAFNIFPDSKKESDFSLKSTTADISWNADEIFKKFSEEIKSITVPIPEKQKEDLRSTNFQGADSLELYLLMADDSVMAIGFPMKGKGLWGTITAFGVISADLKRMIGIDFIEQVETPGLGARILEIEFKRFFRGLDLSGFFENSDKPVVMVSSKTVTNLEQPTNELQAITGATQTCNGVVNMLNTDLKFYLKIIRDNLKLIKAKARI